MCIKIFFCIKLKCLICRVLWWINFDLPLLHLLALGPDIWQELICKLKETPRYTKAVLPNRHV